MTILLNIESGGGGGHKIFSNFFMPGVKGPMAYEN